MALKCRSAALFKRGQTKPSRTSVYGLGIVAEFAVVQRIDQFIPDVRFVDHLPAAGGDWSDEQPLGIDVTLGRDRRPGADRAPERQWQAQQSGIAVRFPPLPRFKRHSLLYQAISIILMT